MEVESVVAYPPGYGALLTDGGGLVGLALDAYTHTHTHTHTEREKIHTHTRRQTEGEGEREGEGRTTPNACLPHKGDLDHEGALQSILALNSQGRLTVTVVTVNLDGARQTSDSGTYDYK